MTVRPPQTLAPAFTKDTGLNILEYELMSERADALGRHGLKVEKALALLAERLAAGCPQEEREELLDDAATRSGPSSSSGRCAACAARRMRSAATRSLRK